MVVGTGASGDARSKLLVEFARLGPRRMKARDGGAAGEGLASGSASAGPCAWRTAEEGVALEAWPWRAEPDRIAYLRIGALVGLNPRKVALDTARTWPSISMDDSIGPRAALGHNAQLVCSPAAPLRL